MAAEEKLESFLGTTIESIRTENEEAIGKTKAELEADLEEYRKKVDAVQKEQERLGRDGVKRELMKELATKRLVLKRQQAEKENLISEKVLDEVVKELERFTADKEYTELLIKLAKKIIEYAGEDEVEIYISRKDEGIREEVAKGCGHEIKSAKTPFVGGIQAEIPSRNIFINHSFSSHIEKLRRNYVVRI